MVRQPTQIDLNATRMWQNVYWKPQRSWEGETVFCLGGGPSLKDFDASVLQGRGRVIATNSACYLAPWADVLLFLDAMWFEKHERAIKDWQGRVVSTCLGAKSVMPHKILRVQTGKPPEGFRCEKYCIRVGCSSGHAAVGLAVAMGASRVVLLGYDCRLVGGESHFHNHHMLEPNDRVFVDRFIPGFKGWYKEGVDVGCEILNATPGSALEEFPRVDLDDFLRPRCSIAAA